MFDTLPVAQVEQLIGLFCVPMFVIERQDPSSEFRMVGMNSALEELAGRPRSEIHGRSISEISPIGMPDDAQENYLRCADIKDTVRFTYLFMQDDREVRWDTTLQYACSPERYDRVIATTIQVPQEQPLLEDKLAFEDVRYFSSIADLQLENLSSAFSCATQDARVTPIDEERMMRLHAVCRTVQRSVADINDIVRKAQCRHAAPDKKVMVQQAEELQAGQHMEGMDTIRAFANAWQDRSTGAPP